MSDFKIKFRGVRGSYPVARKNVLKYGGNTACVEVNVGGNLIILDAGTGIIGCGQDLIKEYANKNDGMTATILISHIHQDHLEGLAFFAPVHLKTSKISIFGRADFGKPLAQELSDLFFGKLFPLDLKDIASHPRIYDIKDCNYILLEKGKEPELKCVEKGENIVAKGEAVIITCYKSDYHPQKGVVVYKISYKGKSLVFATDKETYGNGDEQLAKFANGCDLLIHDAQYTAEDYPAKKGYGHSTFDMALRAKSQANAKKLVFFHLEPVYDDNKLDSIEKEFCIDETVFMAHEGLEIEL